jgi:hypothetical protein
MTWPFKDPPDLGVFLARDVFEGRAQVDAVTHDLGGDWIFFERQSDDETDSDDDMDHADAWVLAYLSAMVERWPFVCAIADLPRGWLADRLADGSWDRYEADPDVEQ